MIKMRSSHSSNNTRSDYSINDIIKGKLNRHVMQLMFGSLETFATYLVYFIAWLSHIYSTCVERKAIARRILVCRKPNRLQWNDSNPKSVSKSRRRPFPARWQPYRLFKWNRANSKVTFEIKIDKLGSINNIIIVKCPDFKRRETNRNVSRGPTVPSIFFMH